MPVACVSVPDQRTQRVLPMASDPARAALAGSAQELRAGPLLVRSLAYKPALVPLADFFKRLSQGEFRRAMRSFHVRYSSMNTDDEALRTLISRGYAPVYVEITNPATSPMDAGLLKLELVDGDRRLAPLTVEELPKAIEGFNPSAAAANIYNTGAAIVGIAAFLAVLAATFAAAARGDSRGVDLPFAIDQIAARLDGDVYNSVNMTTNLEYDGLLFQPKEFRPGEPARGLLFFHAGDADWTSLRLSASLVTP